MDIFPGTTCTYLVIHPLKSGIVVFDYTCLIVASSHHEHTRITTFGHNIVEAIILQVHVGQLTRIHTLAHNRLRSTIIVTIQGARQSHAVFTPGLFGGRNAGRGIAASVH